MKEAAIRKFTTKIRIYWSDCDPAGIAYYGNFFRWYEMAEEELFGAGAGLGRGGGTPQVKLKTTICESNFWIVR